MLPLAISMTEGMLTAALIVLAPAQDSSRVLTFAVPARYARSTKLLITRFSPALSNAAASLFPSTRDTGAWSAPRQWP